MAKRIIAFCHIPKAAGSTLRYLLCRHFGVRHACLYDPRHLPIREYFPRDLRVDLKVYPFVESLAGHHLRPYVDFEEFEGRLAWYTILRDPVKRFISQYTYTVERLRKLMDFRTWMRTEVKSNLMVRFIAGCEDLERAKEILAGRLKFVGLTEKFNESLVLMRHVLEIKGFDVSYPRPMNTAARRKGSLQQDVMANFDEFRDEAIDMNRLDMELYDFAVKQIWAEQAAKYGQKKLQEDAAEQCRPRRMGFFEFLRLGGSVAYNNLVWKPSRWFDRDRYKDIHASDVQ